MSDRLAMNNCHMIQIYVDYRHTDTVEMKKPQSDRPLTQGVSKKRFFRR